MIYACRRLVEKYPALVAFLAGVWIAIIPVTFDIYCRQIVTDGYALSGGDVAIPAITSPSRLNPLELILIQFHDWRGANPVLGGMFSFGCAVALIGLFYMIRRRVSRRWHVNDPQTGR